MKLLEGLETADDHVAIREPLTTLISHDGFVLPAGHSVFSADVAIPFTHEPPFLPLDTEGSGHFNVLSETQIDFFHDVLAHNQESPLLHNALEILHHILGI